MTYRETLKIKNLEFCKGVYSYIFYTYSSSYGNLMKNTLE